MPGHLVLVGGGHAHLTTLSNIRKFIARGHRVTVIGPSPYHYYSGMAPGMISGLYRPQEIRFNIRKMVEDRGGEFVLDRATGIQARSREVLLKSGSRISYDIVSFNIGSRVPRESIAADNGTVITAKPIENLVRGRMAVLDSIKGVSPHNPARLVVVGGGPAGVEISAALWKLAADAGGKTRVILIAGGSLLRNFPRKMHELALNSLKNRGIKVIEGPRVQSTEGGVVSLSDGTALEADHIFLAVGVRATEIFMNTFVPTDEDGGLLVNPYLQSIEFPEIFGAGDCITFLGKNLAKVGVYAVRQNPVLYHNLLAGLERTSLRQFKPGNPDFLVLLNMGDGTGIFRRGEWVWQGRAAFRLKDFIDRRFMKKFQLSGEPNEPMGEV